MVPAAEAAARILEIETLQDEVLRKLDELEARVAQVLAEHLPAAPRDAAPGNADLSNAVPEPSAPQVSAAQPPAAA